MPIMLLFFSYSSAPFVKSRFRQFKNGCAWIVNRILRFYFEPQIGDDGELSQLPLDSFISVVTAVLTEKWWVVPLTVNTFVMKVFIFAFCVFLQFSSRV